MIAPLKKNHALQIARLHISGISTGFISSLGEEFVTALYEAIAESPYGFGFVEEEEGEVVGFVAFSTNLKSLYKSIFLKRSLRFFFLLASQLFSLKRIKKIMETLFYPGKVMPDLPQSELISIAVSETQRGKGIAKKLILRGLEEMSKRDIHKVKVLVADFNEAANRLYQKNGFDFSCRVESHGVKSNIYVADVSVYDSSFENQKRIFRPVSNHYAQLLKAQGKYVIEVDGIDWYDYQGFMMPAYLPHCTPPISELTAQKILSSSGLPFVRWNVDFGIDSETEWWYVLRTKPWDIQQASRNTRSKVRRGMKRFTAKIVTSSEIRRHGYRLCLRAQQRYGRKGFVVPEEKFNRNIEVAENYNDTFEYYGVYDGNNLVGFSENYIQDNAVFLEKIWYDPAGLRNYSSYVFMQGVLEHYLNKRKFKYVLDGSRSIHHKTNIQEYLIDVFGFTKVYAKLNIVYSKKFNFMVKIAYPFRGVFSKLSERTNSAFCDNTSAILKQEYIRKACQ